MAECAVQCTKKLEKAVYLALKFNEPAPWALVRWNIVEQTGWTLEYVDGLDIKDVIERNEVISARNKAGDIYGNRNSKRLR